MVETSQRNKMKKSEYFQCRTASRRELTFSEGFSLLRKPRTQGTGPS